MNNINTKSKRKIKPYKDIFCPRCGCNLLHKYGKEPKSKLNNFTSCETTLSSTTQFMLSSSHSLSSTA